MSDLQFMFDLLLFSWLPPRQQAFVLGAVLFTCWIFTCWYYPISNIMDKTKKSKGAYYLILVILGILPIFAVIVHSLMGSALPPAPPPPPANIQIPSAPPLPKQV